MTMLRKTFLHSLVFLGLLCVFNPFQGQAHADDIDENQLGAW